MGAAASAVENSLAPNTQRRAGVGARKSASAEVKHDETELSKALLKKYDTSKTGKLSRDEVRAIAKDLLTEATVKVGGLEDEDVDTIMRLGGATCAAELTVEELPRALALMTQIRKDNFKVAGLFSRFDTDGSGVLPADQLRELLTVVNHGVAPDDADVAFVLAQAEGEPGSGIALTQLKPALACWYSFAASADAAPPAAEAPVAAPAPEAEAPVAAPAAPGEAEAPAAPSSTEIGS